MSRFTGLLVNQAQQVAVGWTSPGAGQARRRDRLRRGLRTAHRAPGVEGLATKTRLEQTLVAAAADQSVGREVVCSQRLLAAGSVSVSEPAHAESAPAGRGHERRRGLRRRSAGARCLRGGGGTDARRWLEVPAAAAADGLAAGWKERVPMVRACTDRERWHGFQ